MGNPFFPDHSKKELHKSFADFKSFTVLDYRKREKLSSAL